MTIYYVATTGNNSNPGSQSQPFQSIGHASGIVNAGDTVYVLPGTYSEQVDLSRGGTLGNPVTFQSFLRWGAAIVSPSAVASGVSLNAPYLIVDGFDIQAPTFNVAVFFQETSGGSIVRHNKIHNTAKLPWDTGDAVGSPHVFTGTITIDGNWIYDIGTPGNGNNIHGMYLQSNLGAYGTGKVINNIIFGMVSGSGVQLWGDPQGWDVVNNTIFNVIYDGVVMGAPTTYTLANNRIFNNIFYACGFTPVGTVDGGGTYGTGNMVKYNIDFLCTNSYVLNVSITQSNNISATDPQLINYQSDGSGDYHLLSTSPCISAGTSTGAPSTDFDTNIRPLGAGFDLGALEYVPPGAIFPITTRRGS